MTLKPYALDEPVGRREYETRYWGFGRAPHWDDLTPAQQLEWVESATATRPRERLKADGQRVVRELMAIIGRHTSATGEHPVAVAELRNVLVPGSAPMYPPEPGYAPTCSLCAPNGDGHSFMRGRPS